MNRKPFLLAALILALILITIASQAQTKWYINFPSEVVILADSADAGYALAAHGEGSIRFKVKCGETIYATVIDVATNDSYKIIVKPTARRYEDYVFEYRDVVLDEKK